MFISTRSVLEKTLSADSFNASPDPDLRPLSWHQLHPSLGPDQRAFSIYNVRVTKSTKEKIASLRRLPPQHGILTQDLCG